LEPFLLICAYITNSAEKQPFNRLSKMKKLLHKAKLPLHCLLGALLLASISGCANLLSQFSNETSPEPSNNLGDSAKFTALLADELFMKANADNQYRYAVAGFVPVASMRIDLSQQGPLMLLGHQLEQGLITEAVKRGFIAQDFKASNALILSDNSDRALSRDINHLSELQNIDYYITGTITPQQSGAMVNARIINVRNKDVIAAATRFFPGDLFWNDEQVSLRNGHLYRADKNAKTQYIQE